MAGKKKPIAITIKKVGKKFRFVDSRTRRIARDEHDNPLDKGGYVVKSFAIQQRDELRRSYAKD